MPDVVYGILARNRTGPGLKQAERGFRQLGVDGSKQLKLLAAGAAAVGAAVAGIGVSSLRQAADFEKGIREVSTLLDISDEGLRQLEKDTLAFSREVGITTTQVVPALYQAISAGIPRENVFEFLEAAAELSVAGVSDLGKSVDLLSSTLNAYGQENISVRQASDLFFTAVRRGKTTIGEIGSSIANAAPLAATFGVSIEDVVAAFTVLTLSGTPTGEAMTRVRAILEASVTPSKEAAAAMDSLGIEYGSSKVAAEGLISTLLGIIDGADGDERVISGLLPTVEALQGTFTLTKDEGALFKDVLVALGSASGVTAAAFKKMDASTARLYERLRVELEVSMIELGTRLLPLVVSAIDKASSAFDSLKTKVKDLAKEVQAEPHEREDSGWGYLASVIRGWITIGKEAVGGFRQLSEVVGGTGNAALILGGIILGVTAIFFPHLAAIVAITLAIGLLADHWSVIWPAITAVTEGSVNAIITAINVVISAVESFQNVFQGVFSAIYKQYNKAAATFNTLVGKVPGFSSVALPIVPESRFEPVSYGRIGLVGEGRGLNEALADYRRYLLLRQIGPADRSLTGNQVAQGLVAAGSTPEAARTININFSGPVYTQADFDEDIRRAVNAALQAGQIEAARLVGQPLQ